MRVCVYVVLDMDVKVHPREGVVRSSLSIVASLGRIKNPKKKKKTKKREVMCFFKSKPLSSSSSSSEVARAYIKSTRHTT